jgi:hypothetical protein
MVVDLDILDMEEVRDMLDIGILDTVVAQDMVKVVDMIFP